MPSERAIVDTLNRKDLQDLVAYFDLRVEDRRVRGKLVDALAKSRQATLPEMLLRLSVASLKEICGQHRLDATGRKAALVERILAASKPAKKAASVKATKPTKVPAKAAPAAKKAAAPKKAAVAAKAAAAKNPPAVKKPAPARPGKGAKGAAVSKVAEKVAQVGAKSVRAVAEVVQAAAEKVHPGKAAEAPPVPAKVAASPAAKPLAQAVKPQGSKASTAAGGAAPAAAPAAKPTEIGIAAARNVISWGEAVAAVAKRPSAPSAHFLPPAPSDQVRASVQQCACCNADIHLQKCGVQRCNNLIIVTPSRKICAECLFERNTISMTEFNERLLDEGKCPHCGEAWQRAS
jgi:hypothetical protein